MDRPSRHNGIATKWQQSKGVNFFLALIVCLSLLVVAGSPVSANQWSYPGDPGFVATNPSEVSAAKLSWQTPEYGAFDTNYTTNTTGITYGQWGLTAIKASSAYAMGFFGQGVTVGFMDSGSLLTHPEYAGGRYTAVVEQGVYGSSGFRYRPGGTATTPPANPFTAGQSFSMTGFWRSGDANPWNDSHGTSMGGVAGANRNGTGMHGVAWASAIKFGNTGGSDANSHGPYHDYNFVYTGYKALVDAGAQVINSSWGSFVQTEDRTPPAGSGYELVGRDGVNISRVIPADTLLDMEYAHFYFKKAYGPNGQQWDGSGRSFLDGQYEAAKGTSVVMVWSAGNNDMSYPHFRPFYPYFNPAAERHWIATGGLTRTPGNTDIRLQTSFDEAGPYAKWWFMVAPSNAIYTGGVSTSSATLGQPTWSAGSGTSPAAPHVTGSMAVLLSRYPNMDAIQVRDVLFTTANNKRRDGVTLLDLWTAPDGVPDVRYGWGIPDLEKGIHGPGQFLGPFTYNMTKAPLDVWSNNISQVAIKAREQEEQAWLADYKANGINGTKDLGANYSLGQYFNLTAIPDMPAGYDNIDPSDAEKWRKEWMDARAAYIQNKIDNKLYTASLLKQGPGTLIMTGDNTYEGGTTVEGGKLSITGSHASSIEVLGGTLGGSGVVGGSIDVDSGVLQPGFAPEEAARITDVVVAPGNVLSVGGDVRIGREGLLAVTVRSASDYTSVEAEGALVLDGELVLDVRGPLAQGTVLTIMTGASLTGRFDKLPENRAWLTGGHLFRVSYLDSSVTLTVMHAVPPTAPPGKNR